MSPAPALPVEQDDRRPVKRILVELPPELLSIAVGRSIVRRIVTFVDADAESSLLVAFSELLANSIDEHRRIDSDEPVSVEVEFGEADVIRIRDRGDGLDLDADGLPSSRPAVVDDAEVPEPDVPERGRGILLAQAFVDGLTFHTGTTGTTVEIPLIGLGIVR